MREAGAIVEPFHVSPVKTSMNRNRIELRF